MAMTANGRAIILNAVLLLWAGSTVGCRRSDPEPTQPIQASDLRADLTQLRGLIEKHHPQTFTDSAHLHSVFETQLARLTTAMNVIDFYRIARPLVAAVQCSHTELHLPEHAGQFMATNRTRMPLDIRWIDESLVVAQARDGLSDIPPGCTLSSINGRSAADIVAALSGFVSADGGSLSFKRWKLNSEFVELYQLCLEATNAFTVAYSSPGMGLEVASLNGIDGNSWSAAFRKHAGSVGGLSLLETQVVPDQDLAVLTIWFFGFYDDLNRFKRLIDPFFEELSRARIGNLILDLRGNEGGDPYSAAYLLGYLVGRPYEYFARNSTFLSRDLKATQQPPTHPFKGQCYVLIDGGCVSTTGHLCAHLRDKTDSVFIGEPTGASGACHGGFREYRLKHTGILVQLPHTSFIAAVNPKLLRQAVRPDYEVSPTVEDLLSERDPAKDKARRLIAAGR